jgi:hypothetical protein
VHAVLLAAVDALHVLAPPRGLQHMFDLPVDGAGVGVVWDELQHELELGQGLVLVACRSTRAVWSAIRSGQPSAV